MTQLTTTFEQLQAAVIAKGHKWFSTGDYNLNLVGIRNMQDLHANTFNDLFCVAFLIGGLRYIFTFACTTDPGTYYRENPMNVDGTMILPPGQHPGLWCLGMHQGKYPALVQRRPVGVWRDNNADNELDMGGELFTGIQGLNCHMATGEGESVLVGKWSAGCQVLANSFDFGVLMALARRSAWQYGDRFTYTLLESTDL